MEYTVVMKVILRVRRKTALELSLILLCRQRKEVLSYIIHTINYMHKLFFKIKHSYNSCKMKRIVRLTQIRLNKCWQCVCAHMLNLKSESKSSVGSLLYKSAVGIVVTFS